LAYSEGNERLPFRDPYGLYYYDYSDGYYTQVDWSIYDTYELIERNLDFAYQGTIIPLKAYPPGQDAILAYIDESGSVVETLIQQEAQIFGMHMGWFEIQGTTTNNDIVFRYWSHTDGCAKLGFWDYSESVPVLDVVSECDVVSINYIRPVNTRIYYLQSGGVQSGVYYFDTEDLAAGPQFTTNDFNGLPFALALETEQLNSDSDTFGDACDNCPLDTNQDQDDSGDQDGVGNVCDIWKTMIMII
jgi:hypothetical protein